MSSVLETSIGQAKKMAQNHDIPGAMVVANQLLSEHPDRMEVWILQGYLHELSEEYEEAKADLTRAIELNGLEP